MQHVVTHPGWEGFEELETYRARGGYAGLERALRMPPADVIALVQESGLRGRGGGAFPTGDKWRAAAAGQAPRYIVANGGEGEPGSIKDRWLMERYPHRILEGLITGAYAVGAQRAYVYLNSDLREAVAAMEQALQEAKGAGYWGQDVLGSGFDLEIQVCLAPARYVAGEETAVLEVLEGRAPRPRMKPPYPTAFGLFGHPTAVNNVETLAHLPAILREGAEWFRRQGTAGSSGTALFTLSGDVCRPGVYELPLGTPLRHLIEQCGGGMKNGSALQAVLPGGFASAPLSPDHIDVPLDYDSVRQAGSTLGCAAVIALSEATDIVQFSCLVLEFFARESCRQCPPCGMGTKNVESMMAQLAARRAPDNALEQLRLTAPILRQIGACHLPAGAGTYLQGVLAHFRPAFERYLATAQ